MPAMSADEFNARYPVGTPVTAYPGFRPEIGGAGVTTLTTRTRSKAQMLGGHTPVVWVDGHGACIALTHIDLRDESPCTAAFTPPSADTPMPCTKGQHPGDPWHETEPVSDPGRAWTWQDGADGSNQPATEETPR